MQTFQNPFTALKQRNFRLYWTGMCVSLIGTWMQSIAQPWLTLTITNDAFLVSIVSACQFLPALFFSLFSGALLDRVDKKRMMIFSQSGLMVVAGLFALMYYTNHVRYGFIVALALCMGVFLAIDAPSRQSIVIDLVDDKALIPNAIALNSMAFNTARIIGPSIAGAVMIVSDVGACFLINTVSFLAIILSLCLVRIPARERTLIFHGSIIDDIRAGIRYVYREKKVAAALGVLLIVATFIPNFNIILSAFAKFTLQGDEVVFGYLMSSMGIGSLIGAIHFAMRSHQGPNRRLIYVMPFLLAMLMILAGAAANFIMIAIALMLIGFSFATMTSTLNSTIQLEVDNQYRGRVMSLYTLFFQGSTPVGNIYAGYFTNTFNPRIGFVACGLAVACCMILLLLVGWRKGLFLRSNAQNQ